jgi:hypothetical protein
MAKQSWIKALLGKVWDEMAPAASHGSSELGAALYTGSGFVLYPRAGKEPVSMESLRANAQAKVHAKDGKEQDRDGREQGGREL